MKAKYNWFRFGFLFVVVVVALLELSFFHKKEVVHIYASGGEYEEESSIYDEDKPNISVGVNSGILIIKATDNTSGVKAVYVNGQCFEEVISGIITIRLQQFDASVEYFTIQAVDNVGNLSNLHKVKNPYYIDDKEENSVSDLPESALPIEVSNAKGTVIEYTNTVTNEEASNRTEQQKMTGKEFYTIQTENGKVFYLIVDNSKTMDNVYFLTEISENDLLNVTGTNYHVMEQSSVIIEAGLPKEKQNVENTDDAVNDNKGIDIKIEEITTQEQKLQSNHSVIPYVFLVIIAVIVVVIFYFLKVYRKKGEDFEDEDEEEELEEVYEKEEEPKITEDNFFDPQDEEDES